MFAAFNLFQIIFCGAFDKRVRLLTEMLAVQALPGALILQFSISLDSMICPHKFWILHINSLGVLVFLGVPPRGPGFS